MVLKFLEIMTICDYTCLWYNVRKMGCVGPKSFLPRVLSGPCEFPDYRRDRSPELVVRYKQLLEHQATLNRINSAPKAPIQAQAWDDFSNLFEPSDLEILETARGFV